MNITRQVCKGDANTFLIKPVRALLSRYVVEGSNTWLDPFANSNSPACVTNDINPEHDTDYHLDALEFLQQFDDCSAGGVLLDPPYSHRQVTEHYHGNYVKKISLIYREIERVLMPGGLVVHFGWNSNGIGKARHFKIIEVMLIAHGAEHNDTIVTVEEKLAHQHRLEFTKSARRE